MLRAVDRLKLANATYAFLDRLQVISDCQKFVLQLLIKQLQLVTVHLQILLAIYATLSWLEFDLLQCSTISLIITPILAVLQGVQVLQIRKCYREAAGSDMLTFMIYFTGK